MRATGCCWTAAGHAGAAVSRGYQRLLTGRSQAIRQHGITCVLTILHMDMVPDDTAGPDDGRRARQSYSVQRQRAVARRRRLAPLSAVVVGGEPIFWPGRARYGGVALAKQYPNALGGSPLKYVNAGTQVGSPAALLGLIRCMRAARQHGQAVGEWSTSWRIPTSAHGSRSHEPAPEGLQGAPHRESELRYHTA